MFQRLTSSATVESARQHIAALVREHAEWFCTQSPNETYALRRNEIDVAISQGRLILSCWTEEVDHGESLHGLWNGQTLILQASRKMGAEQPLIELVPRASAKAVSAVIKAARQFVVTTCRDRG
jgi:hypothetical protein